MKYLAITAILCLILAGASFAGNVTMTEVISGGDLTLTMPDNFSLYNITIGGAAARSATADAYYIVEDARGTGAGWNLGFQFGQFVTSGTPQRSIPANKTLMDAQYLGMTVLWGQAQDSINGPKSWIQNPTYISVTEVKGPYANAGYGMGKYRMKAMHAVTIDADIYAGTYTATLTATLNNVP